MPSDYFNKLTTENNSTTDGLMIGCLTAIIIIAFSLFFSPFICRYAWDLIAVRRFSLPAFTYWEWFWALWGIRMFLPNSLSYGGKK